MKIQYEISVQGPESLICLQTLSELSGGNSIEAISGGSSSNGMSAFAKFIIENPMQGFNNMLLTMQLNGTITRVLSRTVEEEV